MIIHELIELLGNSFPDNLKAIQRSILPVLHGLTNKSLLGREGYVEGKLTSESPGSANISNAS